MSSLKASLTSGLLLLAAAVTAAPKASNAKARGLLPPGFDYVNLRIEGSTTTIFENVIISGPQNVTTPSGGTHLCNGQNDGANPEPGATATGALNTASKLAKFPFDGTFDAEFDDFFITSIGPDTETSTEFWGLLNNFQFTPVGGCQFETVNGDNVLWAFNAFNAVHFLDLTGPEVVEVGKTYELTVTDGSTGEPVEGATVGTATSNSAGLVTLTAPAHPGATAFKANAPDSIRSQRHEVLFI
jgi:hypothetical protein